MKIQETLKSIKLLTNNEQEEKDKYIAQQINGLTEGGLLSIVLPGRKFDFNEQNTISLLQLLKAVGRTDLSLGRIYEGHLNALYLIHLFASPEQKKQWFADAADGCLFGVWNTGTTEDLHIIRSDDAFELKGKKSFASGAGLVKRAVVTGTIEADGRRGWQMSVIDTNQFDDSRIDYTSWQPPGMQASLSYTVDLCGYSGSVRQLLGKPDDYYRQPHFGGGAVRFCAVQLGGAEALFNETVAYLKKVNRMADPYQSARIADMTTEITAGILWLERAARHWDEWHGKEEESSRLIAFVNLMRGAIERICLCVIELSSKCVGARGLLPPHRIGQIVSDLQFYIRQPAPDTAMLEGAKYIFQSGRTIETLWHEDIGTC